MKPTAKRANREPKATRANTGGYIGEQLGYIEDAASERRRRKKRAKRKVESCRHYHAWRFYFEGPSEKQSPSWCPECGALRHSVYREKIKGFEMKWSRITEQPTRRARK